MYMPAFAETFGIRPWEYWQLTVVETRLLETYIDRRVRESTPKD